MNERRRPPSSVEASMASLGVGVLVLVSPLRRLWAHASLGAWGPFVAWGLVIAVAALLFRAAARTRE